MLSQLEPVIFAGLAAIAGIADEQLGELAKGLGDRVNDAIESSDTEFDDYAKDRLVNVLEAFISELKVDGVDD